MQNRLKKEKGEQNLETVKLFVKKDINNKIKVCYLLNIKEFNFISMSLKKMKKSKQMLNT